MCGRVFQTLDPKQLLKIAGAKVINNEKHHETGYNVAPSDYLTVIRLNKKGERELEVLEWGQGGPFGQQIYNARSEEAEDKKMFKNLVDESRCVVIVDGYFEWNSRKRPFAFRPAQNKKSDDVQPLYLAGFITKSDHVVICTREALKDMHKIHARMPVVLDETELDTWLDSDNNKYDDIIDDINDRKKPKWNLDYYEVSDLVNDTKNKTEKVIMKKEDLEKESSTNDDETETEDSDEGAKEDKSSKKKSSKKRKQSTNSDDLKEETLKKTKKTQTD